MGQPRGSGDEEDLLQLYLNDIGRHPLLSREDEVRLGEAIAVGREAEKTLEDHGARLDDESRQELAELVHQGEIATRDFIRSNLRLVVSIAKRYQSSGVALLDLIQEGNFGLMHAVQRFDPRRGFKFSTYATWWIRQTISRGIANTSRAIRLPVHAGDQLLAIRMTCSSFELTNGRPPTSEELAQSLSLSPRKVEELLPYMHEPSSLSEQINDGEGELSELVHDENPGPDQVVLSAMLPTQVADLLSVLEPREREILCLRYGLDRGRPRTLEEVGKHFGLTREGVRQAEMKAIGKLRRRSASVGRDLLTA